MTPHRLDIWDGKRWAPLKGAVSRALREAFKGRMWMVTARQDGGVWYPSDSVEGPHLVRRLPT